MHRNRTRITAALAVAAAAAGVLLTGCSMSNPGGYPPPPLRLSCNWSPLGTGMAGNTVTDTIRALAADDRAIGGNWTAAQEGMNTSAGIGSMTGPGADAAQEQAITDLTSDATPGNFLGSMPVTATGPVVDKIGALVTDAGTLTNWQGMHPDGLSTGPAVHRDIRALAAMCGAS
jgi:hypothetical protein